MNPPGQVTRRDPVGYLPAAVLLVLAVGFTAMAARFGEAARFMPRLVGVAVLVLCLLDTLSRTPTGAGRAVARWLNPASLKEAGAVAERARLARQTVAILGVLGLVACLAAAGILPSIALFGLLAFRFGAGLGWLRAGLIAACLVLMIWLLFGQVLGLTLYPGLAFGGDVA